MARFRPIRRGYHRRSTSAMDDGLCGRLLTPRHPAQAFQLFAKFFDRIRDRVLPQIQPAVDELEALPSTSDESLVRSKLLAFGDKLFRTLRSELSRLELKPSPAESADDKRLDSVSLLSEASPHPSVLLTRLLTLSRPLQCFLLLVDQDRIERLLLLREWTTLTLELTERGAFLDEIASVINPIRDTLPPTANLSIYTHLLVALARRFPPAHRLILHPIMEKHVLRATMSWKCTEGEDGTMPREVRADCLFDALGRELVLCPEGEEEPAALQRLTPFCSVSYQHCISEARADRPSTDPPLRLGHLRLARLARLVLLLARNARICTLRPAPRSLGHFETLHRSRCLHSPLRRGRQARRAHWSSLPL